MVRENRSSVELAQQQLRARRRFAITRDRHSGQRAEPKLRAKRRLAHLVAADARPGRGRPARYLVHRHDLQRGPLPVCSPRPTLRLLATPRRRCRRGEHDRLRLFRPRALLDGGPHRAPLPVDRQRELAQGAPHLQVRRRHQLDPAPLVKDADLRAQLRWTLQFRRTHRLEPGSAH